MRAKVVHKGQQEVRKLAMAGKKKKIVVGGFIERIVVAQVHVCDLMG